MIRDGRNYSNGYLNALWQWRKVKTATDSVVQSLEKQFLIDDTAINTSLLTTRLDNLEKLLRKGGAIKTEGPVGRESSITGENKWKIAARTSINTRTSTQATRSSAIPTQGRQSGVPNSGVTKTFVQRVIETKKDSNGHSPQNDVNSKLEEISEEMPSKNPFSALDNLESESPKKHSSVPSSKTSLKEVKKTNSDHTQQGGSMGTEQEKCSIQRSQSGPNRKFSLHHRTVMRKIALQLQSLENKQYVVNNEINSMKMLIQSLSEDTDEIEMVEEDDETLLVTEVSHHDYNNQPSSSDDDKPVVNQNRRDTTTHNKGRRGAFISI